MTQADGLAVCAASVSANHGVDLILVYAEVTEHGSKLVASWGLDESGRGQVPQVDVSELVRTGATELVVENCAASPLFRGENGSSVATTSAVLFRVVLEGVNHVVVFGLTDPGPLSSEESRRELRRCATERVIETSSKSVPAGPDAVARESLIDEITKAVEWTTNYEDLIAQIGRLVEKALGAYEPRTHGSIWLVEDRHGGEAADSDARAAHGRIGNLVLRCRHVFGKLGDDPEDPIRPFGSGVIGWVGDHRLAVHEVVDDRAAVLRDGRPVIDQFIPWRDRDETRAELALPMVYAGRLVGVLNLERPEPQLFSPECVQTARILALHSAQAIHQHRINRLYSRILELSNVADLCDLVVRDASQLIEAPSACIYLWDVERQSLCLAACTSPIETTVGGPVELGAACYDKPGIGLTRWAFDQGMWLRLNDVGAYSDPAHPEHARQVDDVRRQVLRQALGPRLAAEAETETVDVLESDRRLFWRVRAPGREEFHVPRPIWSALYRFVAGASKSMIVLPIVDARGNDPVLGVMLFSRRDEGKPFSDDDVVFLQALAKQIAPALLRTQTDSARDMERDLVSQVVRMEPTYWRDEFQYRLKERLRTMRSMLGADLVLVRLHENNELTLVAHDPDEAALSEAWGEAVRIPTTMPVGLGGSGRAAERGRPYHIPNNRHEESRKVHESITRLGKEGAAFLAFDGHVQSVLAVPLIVGGQLVGTLTAVSSQEARRSVEFRDGEWSSAVHGVLEDHAAYLVHHARWLGPALETLSALVYRSRQLSSLSTAVRKLTETVPRSASEGHGGGGPDFHFAAMVVATHHDGLGFHQAFLAECDHDDHGREVRLRAKGHAAWGAFGSIEQLSAHQRQSSLEADIDAAMANSRICDSIQQKWSDFFTTFHELPYLPDAPCIFVRDANAPSPTNPRVAVHRAVGHDAWGGLLDAFCDLFSIPLDSESARTLALGMVTLGKRNSRVKEVMFVTNVGFRSEGGRDVPYVDPMPVEAVDVLDNLGVILTLAGGVKDLDHRLRRYRQQEKKFRQKLNELDLILRREGKDGPAASDKDRPDAGPQ